MQEAEEQKERELLQMELMNYNKLAAEAKPYPYYFQALQKEKMDNVYTQAIFQTESYAVLTVSADKAGTPGVSKIFYPPVPETNDIPLINLHKDE